MGIFRKHDQADTLIDLLDRECNALLAGKFDVLRRLGQEKERVLKQGFTKVHGNDLARIKQSVARNQAILDASARGIRSALQALDEKRVERAPFQTYDQSGKRAGNTLKTTGIERRI
jgi:hypothetical protein